jgi:hypothetical protein
MDRQPEDVPEVDAVEIPAVEIPAMEVLRQVWAAAGTTAADLDDSDTTKVCKRMTDVGFGGLAGPDGDLRSAWRDRLEREGKLTPGAVSIRDLVLGAEVAR